MSETSKIHLRLNRRDIFVVACLVGALVSAISLSFVKSICSDCADASSLAPVPGLNIIGAVFYGALLVAMIRFGLTSRIAAAISFGVGVHLSLAVVMAINQIACIPCLLSLLLIVSAGLAATPKLSPRFLGVWTGAGILVCSAAFVTQSYWTRMEQHDVTRKAIGFSKWPKQSSGPIVVTVFYSNSCKRCDVYKQEMLTRAQQRFGKDIIVKYKSNPSTMLVPTTVVGGEEPTLLIGKPSWDALSGAIETSIAKRRQQSATKSSVILKCAIS